HRQHADDPVPRYRFPAASHGPAGLASGRRGSGTYRRRRRKVEMSLLERARRGLTEMPSNAEWAISRVRASGLSVGAAAEGAASKARHQGRRLSEAAGDAVPFGEDSLQLRMKRAEDAAERAREAEEEAVQAAQEAKELSDHALEVTQRGRARIKQVDRD